MQTRIFVYKNVKCPRKAKITVSVPLILYPIDQSAVIFMALGENREASKIIIIQNGGLEAIFVINNLSLEGIASTI